MSAADIIVLIGGIVLVALAVWGAVSLLIRRQMGRAMARWQAAGLTISKGPDPVNYRGHLQGELPVRGNGVMALTTTDLRVVRLAPAREFVIPLDQITHLAVRRMWRGSYRGAPVIGVYYDDDGEENAIGVIVAARDRQDWLDAIARAAGAPVEED